MVQTEGKEPALGSGDESLPPGGSSGHYQAEFKQGRSKVVQRSLEQVGWAGLPLEAAVLYPLQRCSLQLQRQQEMVWKGQQGSESAEKRQEMRMMGL